MLKKIITTLLISLFQIIIVNAETLTINDINYSDNKNIVGEGFKYDYKNNQLELHDYNGTSIKKTNLNIVLVGNNVINALAENVGISGTNVNIKGEGKITINSENYGIQGNYIKIANVSLLGKTKYSYIYSLISLNIIDSDLNIESSDYIIKGGSNSTINNSKLVSKSVLGFSFGNQGKFLITDSVLDMKMTKYSFSGLSILHFNNTKALFYSERRISLYDTVIAIDDGVNTIKVSNDNITYLEDKSYQGYRYLKIDDTILNKVEDEVDDPIDEPIVDPIANPNVETNIENPMTVDNVSSTIILGSIFLVISVFTFCWIIRIYRHE